MGCCSSGKDTSEGRAETKHKHRPQKKRHYVDERSDSEDEDAESDSDVIEAFTQAVKDGNHALMKYYMDDKPELELQNTVLPRSGDSVLQHAIKNEKRVAAMCLLDYRADVTHVNQRTGDTALHVAASFEDFRVATMILKKHPSVDRECKNRDGKTPYMIAKKKRHEEMMDLLMDQETAALKAQSEKQGTLRLDSNFDVNEFVSQFEDPTSPGGVISTKQSTTRAFGGRTDQGRSQTVSGDAYGTKDDEEEDDGLGSHSWHPGSKQKAQNAQAQKALVKTLKARVTPATQSGNPFNRKFKKQKTQALLQEMSHITERQDELPVLEAWLSKRRTRRSNWQKRWVIVRETHILWSDKQRSIEDPHNAKERAKFNGSLDLLNIKEVRPKDTKGQNKFEIVAVNPKNKQERIYEWKAVSPDDRDHWVHGLREHQKYLEGLVDYLQKNQ